MRFLVDECAGPAVARWLRDQNHDGFSVHDDARGASDDEVLSKALDENRILITVDKDFGEKVFREGRPHKGIILLRLDDERAPSKIAVLRNVLDVHSDRLVDQFVVATERSVRVAGR